MRWAFVRREDEIGHVTEGLSREEDDELRILGFLAELGVLSDRENERLVELRLRDRRKEIREPRWRRLFDLLSDPDGGGGGWPIR